MKPGRSPHPAHKGLRELHRERLRFASGKIDENAGYVLRLRGKIKAGNHVGLVLGMRKARRAGVRRPVGERVDGCALGIAFAAGKRVRMNRDQ